MGRLLLPPTAVVERAGVKVGFIGVTTDSSPDYLLPRHRAGLRFLDISRDGERATCRDCGPRACGRSWCSPTRGPTSRTGPWLPRGEIVDEARQMSDEVDVIVAGHTQTRLNLEVPNRSGGGSKLVVEALSYGTAYDQVDMEVDRRTGQVVRRDARTPTTWAGRGRARAAPRASGPPLRRTGRAARQASDGPGTALGHAP